MNRALPNAHRLDLLLEVARRGTIAAAADAVGVTASAVSQQLTILEREAGTALLERGPRGVTLTGAGNQVAERAQAVRRLLEETRSMMDQLSGELAGRVRVASIASAATAIVLPAVERLRFSAPQIDVTVAVHEPVTSIERVVDGSVDLAIIDIYDHVPLPFPDHLEADELLREPLVLLTAPAASPASGIHLKNLREAGWVMPPRDAACGQAVRYACRAAGFEPRVRWETDDLRLLVESVSRRQGIAVLPRLVAADAGVPVDEVELATPSLERRILSVTRSSAAGRPVIRTVLDHLNRQASSMTGAGR